MCGFSARTADLTFSHLASLRAAQDEDEADGSTYAKNGKDSQKIRKVLKNKRNSGCQCSRRCFL